VADRTSKLVDKEGEEDNPEDRCDYYSVGSYVVAVYQGAWYVGQILDKKNEVNALPAEDYVFINFMQRVGKDIDLFKWPDRADKLNTLREDVLFACGAPIPSKATSSSRSITYSLSKIEQKKANSMIQHYKAYYHNKIYIWGLIKNAVIFCWRFGCISGWHRYGTGEDKGLGCVCASVVYHIIVLFCYNHLHMRALHCHPLTVCAC
jgi:hypothetical protein